MTSPDLQLPPFLFVQKCHILCTWNVQKFRLGPLPLPLWGGPMKHWEGAELPSPSQFKTVQLVVGRFKHENCQYVWGEGQVSRPPHYKRRQAVRPQTGWGGGQGGKGEGGGWRVFSKRDSTPADRMTDSKTVCFSLQMSVNRFTRVLMICYANTGLEKMHP